MTKHRKKNSSANFIAQKLITDCLSEDNILRDAVSAIGGGGGGVRYWPPHRVGFLRRFGLKTGIGIHFGHFGLESGIVFEGTTGVYEHIY